MFYSNLNQYHFDSKNRADQRQKEILSANTSELPLAFNAQ